MQPRVAVYCFVLSLAVTQGLAKAALAPHNLANGITCNDCHEPHRTVDGAGGGGMQPYLLEPCEGCHTNDNGGNYTTDSAPYVQTHSSDVAQSIKFGQWSKGCWDCHGHGHNQPPLVEGTYASYVTDIGIITFFLDSPLTVYDANWSDITTWTRKSGTDRGLILKLISQTPASTSALADSFEIIGTTSNTITVANMLSDEELSLPARGSFEIFYGQMIRTSPEATFSGPTTFADDESQTGIDPSPAGVCQVCHTRTNHWRADGSLAADHFSGSNCTQCHTHRDGFAPTACNACHGMPPVDSTSGGPTGLVAAALATGATTPGAHALHATSSGYGYSCDTCHAGGMPTTPISGNHRIQIGFDVLGNAGTGTNYDGHVLTAPYSYEGTNGTAVTTGGSMVCSNTYCHSDAKSLALGTSPSGVSPPWDSNTSSQSGMSCDGCHGYPPTQDSHYFHMSRGFNCELCHNGTTKDGETIADRSLHANGRYDVIPAQEFYFRRIPRTLRFDYTFAPGGGTCSNNTCHQFFIFKDPMRWRYQN